MAKVTLKGVKKSYGQVKAIHGVDMEIQDGEFIVIVGPSGCGKSTLLRMIAGLEAITEGTISIGDRVVNDIEPRDRDIAMVFQNYALYPHMSVYENMSYGLRIRGMSKSDIEKRVQRAAEILQLQPYLQQGIDIKLWPSLKKSPGEGLTVVDVRKEEFGQLLDEYAASWDLEARPTKNNNERRSNARNVLARNAAAIPGYRRLVKFTIIPLADLSLKTINPQEAFKTLQKNKELGIELSNEDVAALVEAPNLGISYQTAEAGEKKAIIGRIERVQKRLNKLNLKLEPAKDRPIVQALRDDIEDILGEIDNVLEGERAAPSARHAGKRRERRKVTFANPVTTVPDPKPPQDKASSSSSFG